MNKRIGLIFILNAYVLFADIKPAPVFTDGMVLQQGEPVNIYGTAVAGDKIAVKFAGQIRETVADENGAWLVTLDPLTASSDPRVLSVVSSIGNQKSTIVNVLVGEVWLAGGQSNMQTPMSFYKKKTQPDINSANDPLLRIHTIPAKYYEGHNSKQGEWLPANPKNTAEFSATAYYFARNLRAALNVPVGVVVCAVGGSPAEPWLSRRTFENDPDLKRILDAYEIAYRKDFADDAAYLNYMDEFEKETREWYRRRAAGETPGPRPEEKMGPRNFKRPGGLYETMLSQTFPYTFKGVIWYQGEANAGQQAGAHYRNVFAAIIKEWRKDLRKADLPFLFVQLHTVGTAASTDASWAELRESQKWVDENIKNTGMAVLVDGGEQVPPPHATHPHSKDKAGYRLSLLARNLVYGETNLICRGPELQQAQRKPGCIELTFTNTGAGLVLNPPVDTAFELCGPDGRYVPSDSRLEGAKIIVSSAAVPEPQYVRYGWRQWFTPILYNKEGLPASPFRTDSFPFVTEGRHYLDQL